MDPDMTNCVLLHIHVDKKDVKREPPSREFNQLSYRFVSFLFLSLSLIVFFLFLFLSLIVFFRSLSLSRYFLSLSLCLSLLYTTSYPPGC